MVPAAPRPTEVRDGLTDELGETIYERRDGPRPRHRRQRAHLLPVQQGPAGELHAGALPQPWLPRLRDGLVRRTWRRVRRTGSKGPDRQYPGSDPALVGDAPVRRARRRRRDPAPDDPRHHAGPASGHRDRGRAQRDDGEALAGARRVRRQVPRHHPGQPRRHRRRAARDRQVQGPSAGRPGRRPAAVP